MWVFYICLQIRAKNLLFQMLEEEDFMCQWVSNSKFGNECKIIMLKLNLYSSRLLGYKVIIHDEDIT